MAAPRTSLRAAYAKHILHDHLLAKYNFKHQDNLGALPRVPEMPDESRKSGRYTGRVCIIGAGVAGLYIAMMLKSRGITNVDILEANDRVGGRCYTQSLPGSHEFHNYYDIGAMRIPDIPWMKPTLDLIDDLKLEKAEYVFSNPDAPCCYWYQHQAIQDKKFKNFMDPIAKDFTTNFDATFKKWLNTDKDNYSTRAFFMAGPYSEGAPNPHWTYNETATAEIYDTSTGLFDQSFTETVIDYADFQAADSNKWYRIDGGMQKLTDALQSRLSSTDWPRQGSVSISVTTKAPVVALSDNEDAKTISVTVAGQKPVEYDMVFNTTAMAPLQKMDLEGLHLPNQILTGIRSLSYDRATKVAIHFSRPWWNSDPKKIYGGVSPSDLPISNVVYPSWNDGPDKPAVLMVSYSWAQDATRMASYVPDYSRVTPRKEDPIVTLCLQNLAKLWSNSPSLDELEKMYMSHHAYAWEHDPWTGGAFALFGPGQFKNVYPEFQGLFCKDKLALCGEALSAHHAWISGALDSAYVKVNAFLQARGRLQDMAALKESSFGGGRGKHAEEMDEELLGWTVLLGDGGGPKGWGKGLKPGRGKTELK